MESDRNYFARRAQEERAAAEQTSDPLAQRTHLELAEAYDRRSAVAPANAARARLIEEILNVRPKRK